MYCLDVIVSLPITILEPSIVLSKLFITTIHNRQTCPGPKNQGVVGSGRAFPHEQCTLPAQGCAKQQLLEAYQQGMAG